MDHADKEVNAKGYKVLTYFSFAGEQIIESTDAPNDENVAMDAWLAFYFAVLENAESSLQALSSGLGSFSKNPNSNSYAFVPLLLLEMKEITESLALYSSAFKDSQNLLDTITTRYICSEEWLKKTNWVPLKKIELPASTPPFRFARHPVFVM